MGGAYFIASVSIGYATVSSIGMVLSVFTRLSDFPASRARFFEAFFVFVCFIGSSSLFLTCPDANFRQAVCGRPRPAAGKV